MILHFVGEIFPHFSFRLHTPIHSPSGGLTGLKHCLLNIRAPKFERKTLFFPEPKISEWVECWQKRLAVAEPFIEPNSNWISKSSCKIARSLLMDISLYSKLGQAQKKRVHILHQSDGKPPNHRLSIQETSLSRQFVGEYSGLNSRITNDGSK